MTGRMNQQPLPITAWRHLARWLLPAALAVLAPGAAAAQTVAGSARAVVVEPLGLVKVEDLRFGRLAAGSTAGTVTVDPDSGACLASGGVVAAGGCGFAEFSGKGVRRLTVRVEIPAAITLTGPNGATMQADALTLGLSPDLSPVAGNGNGNGNGGGQARGAGTRRYQIASDSGIFTLRLGGRLAVAANQAPGTYNGAFALTVQYQ